LPPEGLTNPQVQETLLGEAAATAAVGFLVWDDDRRYVAVNKRACELLGCTLEQIIGSRVGSQTEGGTELVADVVRTQGARGQLTVERFDGHGPVTLEYVSFTTRTAGLPYMGSVIWEAS
jgi:PAS domain-containing protein